MSDESSNLPGININTPPLGDLSKPATKLIDAVFKFLGDRRDPALIVAVAKAKSEAKSIKLKGKIKDLETWERAEERRRVRDVRRQENIEAAIAEALNELSADVNEQPVSEDWLYQWVDHVQDIGDEEMRSVWSKLLAGEVASPGKYTLLTLSKVKTMDRKVAEYFTELMSYLWLFNNNNDYTLLTNTADKNTGSDFCYDQYKIRVLELHGLVYYHDKQQYDLFWIRKLTYYGQAYDIHFESIDSQEEYLSTHASLTEVGKELVSIADGKPLQGHMEDVLDHIQSSDKSSEGTTVTKIDPPKV